MFVFVATHANLFVTTHANVFVTTQANVFVTTHANVFVTTHANVFVATKHVFCRDKNMLVATKLLSRLKLQIFVASNMCLSRQTYFCRD